MSEQNRSLYDNSQYPPRQPQRRRRRRRSVWTTVFKVLGTLALVGVTTGALLCCFGAVYVQSVIMPIVREFRIENVTVGENSVMYYQDKNTGAYEELATLLNTTSSVWVDYKDIPEYLKQAAVAVEDKRFLTHNGVDWVRTAKAVLCMFTGQDIQGGSTITQQLIKNLTDYNETTVKRKVVEIFRALNFDKNYSKEFTLEWYLNIIPLGSKCEGVGAASLTYFGKPVSELSLAECASLIGITNNPSIYSPYSTAKFEDEKTGELLTARDMNKQRQELVLWLMKEQGKISQEEYDDAVAEELVFRREEGSAENGSIYSWYEEQVISDVKDDLMEQYQYSDAMAERLLKQGGLKIYTCVDPKLQTLAESVYENRDNLNYTSADGQKMQSAITIIDNTTGDVAAIVGQVGEKKGSLLRNMATAAKRQPGSSIKPLAVYSPAIEMGLLTPLSVIDDYPYEVLNDKPWPVNSGNERYKGLTTVRQGLTNSVNTIALRILADYVTPEASYHFMEERYHIDLVEARVDNSGKVSTDIDRAPLAMGGLTDGVTTRDMAEAYAVFPNNGFYRTSRTYTKVTRMVNNVEETLLENKSAQEQAVKSTTAYYMNSMLQNVVRAGTGTGANFSGDMAIAGKTGTTSSNYDRWFVGYTPYYTAAVWTGYEYPARMSGGNRSVSMWRLVMEQAHKGLAAKSFPSADGLVEVTVCADSGLLATSYCALDPRGSRAHTEYVFREDAPTEFCTCHTDSSLVTMCMDATIHAADGSDTGTWHIAGAFCPEVSLRQYCLPKYDRTPVGDAVAEDNPFLYGTVEAYGECPVHAQTQAPTYDPSDPFWQPDPEDEPQEPTVPPEDEFPAETDDDFPPERNIRGGGAIPVSH